MGACGVAKGLNGIPGPSLTWLWPQARMTPTLREFDQRKVEMHRTERPE